MAGNDLVLNFRSAIEIWDYSIDDWAAYDNLEDPVFYTLPSNAVKLRINFDKLALIEGIDDLWLSKNFIQWRMGNEVTLIGNDVSYVYYVPGKYNIAIFIARSDGKVMTLGSVNPETIEITIKNVITTTINAQPRGPQGDEPGEWNELNQKIGNVEIFQGYVLNLESSQVSMPIDITTTCTWQLYNENRQQHVSLYAESAGLVFSKTNTRGNESAPLKTAAYDKNKYAQFQKTWRFTSDDDGISPIDVTQNPSNKIYAKRVGNKYELCDETAVGAEFVGISGTSTVFYVDDSPAVLYRGTRYAYRLSFQLDSTDWPGQYNWTHIAEDKIKDHSDYVQTPQRIVAPTDYLRAKIDPAIFSKVVFTSTGIDTHDIGHHKFENSSIAFVMSVGSSSGRIIKHAKPTLPENFAFLNKWDYSKVSDYPENTYVIGLSAEDSSQFEYDDVVFALNQNLSSINLYSSLACTLSSAKPISKVCLYGAINTNLGVIIGRSNDFAILPKKGHDMFFKHGEEIDMGAVIKNTVLQENINQHNGVMSMFDAIFGTYNSIPSSLGKTIYEKITNFTANNSDIDTCNIKALYGLSEEVNRTLQDYNLSYPGDVSRLVNIFSTGVHKLLGTRNKYTEDYTQEPITVDTTGKIRYGRNISDNQLSTETYIITAGVPIVVKELYGNNRFKVVPNFIPGSNTDPGYTNIQGIAGLSSYPLSSYSDDWNWGLSYPSDKNIFSDYYEFYEYIDNSSYSLSSFDQNSGMINWNATYEIRDQHTATEHATKYEDWFRPGGIVDSNIALSLHRGLETIN